MNQTSQQEFSQPYLDALKTEHGAGLTAEQFTLWITECQRRNLVPVQDILARAQSVSEWDPETRTKIRKKRVIYITTIGAFRKIAERTGKYAGQQPTRWVYTDPEGHPTIVSDVPLPDPLNVTSPRCPWAARVSVLRTDFHEPLTAVGRFWAYAQTFTRDNKEQLTAMWQNRGPEQLEKCTEAAALRKAFPEEFSSTFLAEEIREDKDEVEAPPAAAPLTEAPKSAAVPAVNHAPAPLTAEKRPETPRQEGQTQASEPLSSPESGDSAVAFYHEALPQDPEPVTRKNRVQKLDKAAPAAPPEAAPAPPVESRLPDTHLPDANEKKAITEKVRSYYSYATPADLQAFVLRVTGAPSSGKVTAAQWTDVFSRLDATLSSAEPLDIKAAVAALITPPDLEAAA